jgi:hypothetical protein
MVGKSLDYTISWILYAHFEEIRRFWPPLRSLETMHDNLSFKEIDHFLERMMKSSTPLPSPPKTPTQYDTGGGGSLINLRKSF